MLSAFLFAREKWYAFEKKDPEAWKKWNDLKEDIRKDLSLRKKKK